MLSTGEPVRADDRERTVGITEPFRLMALGATTYLSYWKLFFAVCRVYSGPSAPGGR